MTPSPMHAGIHATLTPDRPALIMGGSGASLDFAGLEARSNRFARLVRSLGITSGDRVALLLENCLDYLVLAWGAQRAGLRVVPIATHLAPVPTYQGGHIAFGWASDTAALRRTGGAN